MKKLIFLSPLLILLSCGQPKDQAQTAGNEPSGKLATAYDTLQAIIKANINNKPTIDTICLGYVFNMTQKQAFDHRLELFNSNKLVMNETGELVYPINLEYFTANAIVVPTIDNEKLYQLSLLISPADDHVKPDEIFSELIDTYKLKYKKYTFFEETDAFHPESKSYHWIKSNLHIYISKVGDQIEVEYINMPVEQMIRKELLKSSDSSKKQTQKDI